MIYTHVLNRGGRGVRSPLDTGSCPAASRIFGWLSEYAAEVGERKLGPDNEFAVPFEYPTGI